MQFVTNLSESIEHNLSAAIFHRYAMAKEKIPVLHFKNGSFIITSDFVEPNLLDTFNLLQEHSKLSARRFSEVSGLSYNASGNRLKRLYDYRVIPRTQNEDFFNNEIFYYLPSLKDLK